MESIEAQGLDSTWVSDGDRVSLSGCLWVLAGQLQTVLLSDNWVCGGARTAILRNTCERWQAVVLGFATPSGVLLRQRS